MLFDKKFPLIRKKFPEISRIEELSGTLLHYEVSQPQLPHPAFFQSQQPWMGPVSSIQLMRVSEKNSNF